MKTLPKAEVTRAIAEWAKDKSRFMREEIFEALALPDTRGHRVRVSEVLARCGFVSRRATWNAPIEYLRVGKANA